MLIKGQEVAYVDTKRNMAVGLVERDVKADVRKKTSNISNVQKSNLLLFNI